MIKAKVNMDPKKWIEGLKTKATQTLRANSRKTRAVEQIGSYVGSELDRRVEGNRVIKGLRDKSGTDEDLAAEFGIIKGAENQPEFALLEYNASGAAYKVSAVSAASGRSPYMMEFRVTIKTPPASMLKPMDGFSEIPWMSILLEKPNVTAEEMGIVDHTIINEGFHPRYSRSGRAIMVEAKNYPYFFPSIIRPTERGSKNFLEDIYSSPSMKRVILERIKAGALRIAHRHQKLK